MRSSINSQLLTAQVDQKERLLLLPFLSFRNRFDFVCLTQTRQKQGTLLKSKWGTKRNPTARERGQTIVVYRSPISTHSHSAFPVPRKNTINSVSRCLYIISHSLAAWFYPSANVRRRLTRVAWLSGSRSPDPSTRRIFQPAQEADVANKEWKHVLISSPTRFSRACFLYKFLFFFLLLPFALYQTYIVFCIDWLVQPQAEHYGNNFFLLFHKIYFLGFHVHVLCVSYKQYSNQQQSYWHTREFSRLRCNFFRLAISYWKKSSSSCNKSALNRFSSCNLRLHNAL